MLNLLVGAMVDMLCCRYKWGSYSQAQYADTQQPPESPTSASSNPIYNNLPTEPIHLVTGQLPKTFET